MEDLCAELTERIIGSAIEVHRELGPGLLESVYETCLLLELGWRGVAVSRQTDVPLTYKGIELGRRFRLDLVVESQVVVEVKHVAGIDPIHEAQLLSYLRISGLPVGLILNFQVPLMRDGVRRMIHSRGRPRG